MCWLINSQPYFSVAGLVLDIVGFGLLSWEWWSAVREGEKGETIAELDRAAGARWGRTEEEMGLLYPGIVAAVKRRYGERKRYFALGAVMIFLGFVGQLVGSLPLGACIQ